MIKKSTRYISFVISIVTFNIFLCSNAFAQDVDALANIFGKLPEISGAEISPDGTKIALLQNYQGNKILVTKSLVDASIPQNGIPYPGGSIDWVEWKDNENILVGVSFDDVVNLSSFNEYIFNVDARLSKLVYMRWDGENPVNPMPPVDRKLQPQFQANVVDFLKDDPDNILVQIDVDKQNERGVQQINITRNAKRFKKILRGRDVIQSWKADSNHVVRFGSGTKNNYGQMKVRNLAYYRK
ncbi:MAG: hypothetical protein HOJ34_12540 [Kordiimonadaceae bacterium]|jgi:hypothetical protein|nr:hypothetical protein [Kordiimonadaceae bacterium]MBT6035925.1 hypothetical protein [Kordiimonadaceae bacterium]MBT6330598.1 hypothetical protein [Kordiimonadaceae bacterium]